MKILLAGAILSLSASCAPTPLANSRIGGLLRSDSQFVMSPDRCVLSVLYDNYRLEIPRPPRIQNPTRIFTISGGPGVAVTIDYRGTYDGPAHVRPSLLLKVGSRVSTHQLTVGSDNNFALHHQDRLNASGETPIESTIALTGHTPPDGTSLLIVQSVDVSIHRGGNLSC